MNMKVRSLMVGICVSTLIILSSCNDGPNPPNELDQWLKDIEEIDTYLASTASASIKDPSGIRMVITQLGTGLPAQGNNTVDVDYIGRRFSDQFMFDNGNIKQGLGGLIEGWQFALSTLPAGSEATVYIPSFLGYGSSGFGPSIPPNTILEFDLRFNEVVLSSTEIDKFKADTTAIEQYLTDKGITAEEDPTGLRYVITSPGAGATATWFSKLELKYSIKLLTDDTESVVTLERAPNDNFHSRPVDYIHGLKIGLQKLSIGSKATFYIASGQAFGPEGASDNGNTIPPDANIIVEAELINIQ
jgi:FKBP-type peptidyl-prolyl cis-trans isomerase FkpA